MQKKKLALVIAIYCSVILTGGACLLVTTWDNEVAKSKVAKEISVTNEQPLELQDKGTLINEDKVEEIITVYAPIVSTPEEEEVEQEEEVVEAKATPKAASYTEDDLERLAHLIYAEAGSNRIPDEALYYTGSVVLNRVKSKYYPNTIKGVIHQRRQYGVAGYYMKKKPTKRCYVIAKDLLENGSVLPKDCVGQASIGMYKRYGKKLYAKIKNIYFFSVRGQRY